jgi:hypothetical protein
MTMSFLRTIPFLLLVFAASSRAEQVVHDLSGLKSALSQANSGTGDKTITLSPGTYALDGRYGLGITRNGITVRGQSGDPGSVVILGQGIDGGISHCFQVFADDAVFENMTLGEVSDHAIQIHGESPSDADRPILRNLVIRDTGQQMVKISYRDGEASYHSDGGLVEDCEFLYTAGIGPQYYIGGIDAHNAHDWIVRRNRFSGIRSPGSTVAEHAIHFWSQSTNTLCEKNWIINCDRGIGFGLGDRGHVGGIIRNNMIYHADLGSDYGDVGIELENSSGTKVVHNTVYLEHDAPGGISVRFAGSTGVQVLNNLIKIAGSGSPIWFRNGATATTGGNVTTANAAWFSNLGSGDLHLSSSAPGTVIDAGVEGTGVAEDFDGEPRPSGAKSDVGADELQGVSSLDPTSWGRLKNLYRS